MYDLPVPRTKISRSRGIDDVDVSRMWCCSSRSILAAVTIDLIVGLKADIHMDAAEFTRPLESQVDVHLIADHRCDRSIHSKY